LAKVFCQASDGFSVVRFVLDAVESGKNSFEGARASNLRGKPSDGVKANRRRVLAWTGQSNFHAVGKAREGDLQLRMRHGQMLKSLRAGSDHRGLQASGSIVLEPGDIGEIADHTSGSGRQARVRIEEQAKNLGFSGHGYWQVRLRRLPGNPGNSRDRPCTSARCFAPGRWCSIFRRCSALPASRIARNGLDLAWGLSGNCT